MGFIKKTIMIRAIAKGFLSVFESVAAQNFPTHHRVYMESV